MAMAVIHRKCHKLMHMRAVEKDIDTSLSRPVSADDENDEPRLSGSATLTDSVRSSPSIWRRIRRDVVLLGAGSVSVATTQLVFRSMLIAVLVPASYGRLSLVLSIYNFVLIIGTSGLPNGVARYIALITPADDSKIVRSAFQAGAWPTLMAAVFVAAASGVILNSPLAFLYGAVGLSCLVYTVIITGILRGRGRIGSATSIMPIGGVGEVTLLLTLIVSRLGVTSLSAFGVFCFGNVIGLAVGIFYTLRTAPLRAPSAELTKTTTIGVVPNSRELLGSSMWLGAAAVGTAILPLVVRLAAALDSYTVVAIVDVALVLLSVPLRMGAVIVSAVVPHATRELSRGGKNMTISRREQLTVITPFVLAAIAVYFTPIVGWLFDSLGRPEYAKSAVYLALALLAGPARVLYGLVEGVLVAHGDGKFLAFNSLSIATVASGTLLAAAALGSMVVAFTVFVVACWAVYVCGLQRIKRLSSIRDRLPTPDMAV
jgi:O-antigen/teichoic acid export membrane protein